MDICTDHAACEAIAQLSEVLQAAIATKPQQQQQGWRLARLTAPLASVASFGMQTLLGALQQPATAKAHVTDDSDLIPRQNTGLSSRPSSITAVAKAGSPEISLFHGEPGLYLDSSAAVTTSAVQHSFSDLGKTTGSCSLDNGMKELQMMPVSSRVKTFQSGMYDPQMTCRGQNLPMSHALLKDA